MKRFTKGPLASLLHCIENILNHPWSGKCRDSLTMADLSSLKSTGLCTIFIHLRLLDNSVIISLKEGDTDTSLRACSHEPGIVNYPEVMIAPGQALPRVHMMICCPGAMLPRVNFIAPGQVHRHLITTNLS